MKLQSDFFSRIPVALAPPLLFLLYVIAFAYAAAIIVFVAAGPVELHFPLQLTISSLDKPIGFLSLALMAICAIKVVRGDIANADTFVVLAVLLFMFILGLQGLIGPVILGDAGSYYAWTRTAILDGDLDFSNDYAIIYEGIAWDIKYGPDGRALNKYPIGAALYEAPGFLLGHMVSLLGGGSTHGFSAVYVFFVAASNLLLFHIAFYYYTRTLCQAVPASVAATLSLALVLGTNVVHYLARDVGYAHVPGVTAGMLLIHLSVSRDVHHAKLGAAGSVLTGFLLGFLLVTRYTNIALLPFFGYLLARRVKAAPVLAGIAALPLVQGLITNHMLGGFLADPYGGGEFPFQCRQSCECAVQQSSRTVFPSSVVSGAGFKQCSWHNLSQG